MVALDGESPALLSLLAEDALSELEMGMVTTGALGTTTRVCSGDDWTVGEVTGAGSVAGASLASAGGCAPTAWWPAAE